MAYRRFTRGTFKSEVKNRMIVYCNYEDNECNDSCLHGAYKCDWVEKALCRLSELEDKIEHGTLKEIPENAVVFIPTEERYALLSKEEYERWQGQTLNIKKVRKETADKFSDRLKKRFNKSREYYEIDTGTAWSDGQIGGLINETIDKICKEITEGKV